MFCTESKRWNRSNEPYERPDRMKYRPTPPLRLLRYLARSVEANGFRKTLVDFCQRLFHSLRDRGIDGTLQRAVSKPTKIPKGATFLQPHPFDLIHGTDTGGGTFQGQNSQRFPSQQFIRRPISISAICVHASPFRVAHTSSPQRSNARLTSCPSDTPGASEEYTLNASRS